MIGRPLAGCALVALASGCVFDLPPLAGSCEGDGCGGSGAGGEASQAGGSGPGGSTGDGIAIATPGDEVPEALAVTADGDLLVLGTFRGSLSDPQRGELPSRGRDTFLARLGPDGATRWLVTAGSDGDDLVFGSGALAVMPNGEILMGVRLGNAARRLATPTGDVELPLSTNEDGFVLQLDASGGFVDLGHIDGQSAATSVRALLPDAEGYRFGGSWGTSADGAFVGSVDGARNAEWIVTIGGSGSESVDALVPNGAGVVAIVTDASGIFALQLGADGSPGWASGIGATTRPQVRAAVALDGGRFAIVGTTTGTLSPSGLAPLTPTGDGDGFVVLLASDGQPINALLLGDASPSPAGQPLAAPGQAIFGATRLGDGIAIAGAFLGALDGGGVKLLSETDHDAFFVHLDPSLVTVSGIQLAGPSSQWGAAVATRPDGSLVGLLGTYGDVGGHVLVGGADVVVLPDPL